MSSPVLNFDGSGDDVSTSIEAPVSGGTFSTGGWIKLNSDPGDPGRKGFVSTYDGSQGFILGPENGVWRFFVSFTKPTGGSYNVGTWQHIVGTRESNGDVKLYINGEVVDVQSSNSDDATGDNISIGSYLDSNYIDAEIDDVRWITRSINQSEVKKWMNGGVIGSEHTAYPMNEGSGNELSAYGRKGENNHGSINGASWSSRSGGNTYSWSTSSDWDNAQSYDDVEWFDSDLMIGQQPQKDGLNVDAYYNGRVDNGDNPIDVSGNDNHGFNQSFLSSFSTPLKFENYYGKDENASDSSIWSFSAPSRVQSDTTLLAFEAWVYPNEQRANQPTIFEKVDYWKLTFDDLTDGGFSIRISGDNTGSIGPTNLSLNQWHHVNIYWDVGNEIGLSVNGGEWDTVSSNDGIDADPSGNFRVGKVERDSNHFDGRITDIRFVSDSKIPIDGSLYQKEGTLRTAEQS